MGGGSTLVLFKRGLLGFFALLFAIIILLSAFRAFYAGKIFPGVTVGSVELGGLNREVAEEKLSSRIKAFSDKGLQLQIDGKQETVKLDRLGITVSPEKTFIRAWSIGRSGSLFNKIFAYLSSLFRKTSVVAELNINEATLFNEINLLSEIYDFKGYDVRLNIVGDKVSILYDTKEGLMIDQEEVQKLLINSAVNLNSSSVEIKRKPLLPHIDSKSALAGKLEAERMMSSPLTLVYGYHKFKVTSDKIGSWIESNSDNQNRLRPVINERKLSIYVTEIAQIVNSSPQKSVLEVVDGKVVNFEPPREGRLLREDETIKLIANALEEKRNGNEVVTEISLPVVVEEPIADGSAAELGIVELIGKATTSFVGSPPNRISNIKNGTKFLNGLLIKPGDEFSTLGALGKIDNTSGYLPELVIKGDRTIPEFGGGLCQVSTTLFRAVLDTGLPVTSRRNHSYRVSYYEKDGEGNYIGPGLDATIYSPSPDFRFKNDTKATIIILGYVKGNFITFELYGTKDGRKSIIDGPHTLSTIPTGDPIYANTDTIPVGEKKMIERAHPGGSATALYIINYADGKKVEQKFDSYYRPWPERWLVGAETEQLTTETPSDKPTEEPSL